MHIKNMSPKQVRWVQKLSRYKFRIDYCQEKANEGIDVLSGFGFAQKSQAKEKTSQVENSQILRKLTISPTTANLGSPITKLGLSILHQVFIYRTHIFPNLIKLWGIVRAEIVGE